MKLADWLLLALILGYCLWLLFRPKKPNCLGDCRRCKGCKGIGNHDPQTGGIKIDNEQVQAE